MYKSLTSCVPVMCLFSYWIFTCSVWNKSENHFSFKLGIDLKSIFQVFKFLNIKRGIQILKMFQLI